ncbi:MAG TPA: tripartite tricarboxylate transporter substrate-binding protein [Thermodesulfobacteriota bacterium]|nr:tripartite tricarboxylate transporter substrate-binding protein [Thermodesulfobacteriota bacterium]
MRARRPLTIACALLAGGALVWPGRPAQAGAAPENYYQGKTVTIVVGFRPGGSSDAIARLLARHLPKHIPGRPTFIVQNMPGANSIVAANHVYNVAKPDGLTLGIFNRSLPLAQLAKVEGVQFDITRFVWIASMSQETTVLTVRSELPYKTVEDLRRAKEPVVIGATGAGSNSHDFPALLKELLGFNLKLVTGYSSSPDILLAIERKEVDGAALSPRTIRPLIERGVVRPLLRARVAEPGVEHLPVDEDLTTDRRIKGLLALRSAPGVISRPFVMPPGTPPELARIMREAFARVARDQEFLAEAERSRIDISYVPGDDALKTVKEILAQPPEVVQEFSKYLRFGD